MTVRLYQVDAFATAPFTGNPAAVCLLDHEPSSEWMQLVAREMNLSETAFVRPADDGFSLRWFTPAVEVELCGHATLASAHVLWEGGQLPSTQAIRFATSSGVLTATCEGGMIELDFPATLSSPADAPDGLEAALGAIVTSVERNRFDLVAELESEDQVRDLVPRMDALREIDARGVIVTASSRSADYDFVSRFFGPRVGVDEDPVTGSAHCCLGPYWASRLEKSSLVGYQASSRGGMVQVSVAGDRVRLGGRAITVMQGELL